ncbi:single-stranded DNA-binding protein, partial [Leucobacter albus]
DNQGAQRTSLDLEVEEVGPSLRFATATVTRGATRGQGGFTGAQAGPQSQSAWNQPQNGGQSFPDPGGFDDEQPF